MPPFTQDQLHEAAKHLGYEWAMLLGARDSDWDRLPASNPVQKIANDHARTEVILLHTRVIYEFLFLRRSPQHPDDVRAFDYLSGNAKDDWEINHVTLVKKLCPTIEKDWDRLNKKLFHLSYERIQLPDGWKHDVVIGELKAAFKHFCEHFNGNHGELLMIHEGLLLYLIDPHDVFGL